MNILNLPSDIIKYEILCHLDVDDIRTLTETSKSFQAAFESVYLQKRNDILKKIHILKMCKYKPRLDKKIGKLYFHAVENGHLDVIKFLSRNKYPYPDNEGLYFLFTQAARYGHLYIIIWLHKNIKNIYITPYEMEKACSHGHIDVVMWLHKNRYCSSSYSLMLAEKHKHLDIIKFLLSHGYKYYYDSNTDFFDTKDHAGVLH